MATEQGVIGVIRASRPTFRGPHDKIAFTVHSSFLAAGYILTAAGTSASSSDVFTSSSTGELGIDGWDQFDDNYAFVYLKKILVKCLAMNDTLLVDVLKNGGEEPLHLEINCPFKAPRCVYTTRVGYVVWTNTYIGYRGTTAA